ncbi:MAG: RDD family protein [Polyangia bacterium]
MTTYAAVCNAMATLDGSAPLQPTGSSETSHPLPSEPVAASHPVARGQRVLRVRAAGVGRRLLAAIIDALLVNAVALGATLVAALALGVSLPGSKELGPDVVLAGLLDRNPMALGALGLLAGLSALYQIYLGGILGQTAGKRLLRLRVISSHGSAPGPLLGCVRFLALLLSLLPVGLGWLWCLFDRERRALHDHLSGTYVIVEDR